MVDRIANEAEKGSVNLVAIAADQLDDALENVTEFHR